MIRRTALMLSVAMALGAAPAFANEEVRNVERFSDLPLDIQVPIARFLVDAKIFEIEEAKAHKITEIKVAYERKHKLHELIWDATNKKFLGGTEPEVLKEVLAKLPTSAQQTIQDLKGQQKIDHLKIKHSDADDHEYVHVHFINESGRKTDIKLEMDGSPIAKKA